MVGGNNQSKKGTDHNEASWRVRRRKEGVADSWLETSSLGLRFRADLHAAMPPFEKGSSHHPMRRRIVCRRGDSVNMETTTD